MKKILPSLFVMILLAACENESISPPISDTHATIDSRSAGNQVSVCHNGNTIHINSNAVPAHQAHGDAVDLDDDGYFDLANVCGSGVDCNDGDPAIYPGAPDVCEDGMDNNCNGEVDEGCIPSVAICDQVWMLQNLDVATYRNGDPIPKVTDGATWASLTTGAYCYYDNDSATYATVYGKLYNWYAVHDPRGLAPEGWHIPSDTEWNTLGECLDGSACSVMKEAGTAHWIEPNMEATNLSGFTALPAGYRLPFGGYFFGIGEETFWWSSSEYYYNTDYVWISYINYLTTGGLPVFPIDQKRYGASVRCLKD